MTGVVLTFPSKQASQAMRAQSAAAAVVLIAARMGYKAHLIARAANVARRDVLVEGKSAARAIADMKRALALAARQPGGAA